MVRRFGQSLCLLKLQLPRDRAHLSQSREPWVKCAFLAFSEVLSSSDTGPTLPAVL